MKKSATLFLKMMIMLVAIIVFLALTWFPQTEGRATNLNLVSIYADPLIIYTYVASLPFFFALYQAIKLLDLIDENKAFTRTAISRLKRIKLASIILVALIAGALLLIRLFAKGDDAAGPIMLGICISLVFAIIVSATDVLQRLFQQAVDLKSK